jgi:hypothetical protein
MPYMEPGVVSPTQPTVMTVDEGATEEAGPPDAEAGPPDAEGLADGVCFAPPDPAAVLERGDGGPVLPVNARTPAAAARATAATTPSSTRRRRMRRRRSRLFTRVRALVGRPDELPMVVED